jgi:hypothetical protein
MMAAPAPLPEIELPAPLRRAIGDATSLFGSIDAAEQLSLSGDICAPLIEDGGWRDLRARVAAVVRERGYVVMRGLDADDGRSLLLAGSLMGEAFGTYGGGRIVKRFRMSPWTKELSHTLAEGSFHTDGNVSDLPPVATAMQCETEDPGGDDYAELRVAHLPDLLVHLKAGGRAGAQAVSFLCREEVPMAHGRSTASWSGRLVSNGAIRYHPESLRVANGRLGRPIDRLETMIASIHRAALAASIPFHTRPGDVVLVSNRHALHYRGACSVRFRRFPADYDTRSLLVLHRVGPDA